MRLGLAVGYWTRQPPQDLIPLVQEAERLGYHSVWTSEAWGSDAFTPLTWIAAHTSTIELGTAIAQMAARAPAATAMHALTLDHLSGGRLALGLGLSGPQVVEGWYGRPFPRSPLTATREYVGVIRAVLGSGRPLTLDGSYYGLPYPGPDGTGLGKPLRPAVKPLRRDLPIFLGAEGPKNIAQTAAIADGWLPLYWSPERSDVYAESLRDAPEGFRIAPMVYARLCEDPGPALFQVKAMISFYIGGMGAKGANFHANLMARMGFASEVARIQELFLAGRPDESIASVPDDFAHEISLIGSRDRIASRLAAFRDSGVTDLLITSKDLPTLRTLAELNLRTGASLTGRH
ncbi:F420-dependent oxidoreductase-like protein [Streptomyces sp. TLI_235]|nr:LLM class F420-dependent oxidoreductase [Streptomyces sp. TLI_235]PBC75554.1 F420-dependent oxidoreductase-like protein [Streptomyces sp. TLI_235]